jgi:hypothetical protein
VGADSKRSGRVFCGEEIIGRSKTGQVEAGKRGQVAYLAVFTGYTHANSKIRDLIPGLVPRLGSGRTRLDDPGSIEDESPRRPLVKIVKEALPVLTGFSAIESVAALQLGVAVIGID